MREIKFRAWSKEKKAFIVGFNMVNFHSYYNAGMEPEIYRYSTVWKLSEIELMQFTGLKDKNGEDIYEGDIVSFEKRMYEVVINFNGYYLQRYKLWRGEFVAAHQYALSLITKPSKDRFGGEVENAEVIGNIHDNPTLLKH